MANDRNLVDRLIELGEGRLESVIQELVANPKVMQAIASVMQRTQQARSALSQRLQQMYTWANLPTETDLAQLSKHLENVEERIAAVGDRLLRLLDAADTRAAAKKETPPARTAAKPTPTQKAPAKKAATTRTAVTKKAKVAQKGSAPQKAAKPAAAKKASQKKSNSAK